MSILIIIIESINHIRDIYTHLYIYFLRLPKERNTFRYIINVQVSLLRDKYKQKLSEIYYRTIFDISQYNSRKFDIVLFDHDSKSC